MKKLKYHGFKTHNKEHKLMLKTLTHMQHKINDAHWNQHEVKDFVTEWGKHIIDADMPFNSYVKQQQGL